MKGNQNSFICRFIDTHDDWREQIKNKYKINVKEDPPYAIFNYGIECDFKDPLVQEARGIIINLDTLEVVCWPFRKFGNYQESYADQIDWATARVQDKVDGSIIKLWNDDNTWHFSTNSMINADNALCQGNPSKSFGDLIREAKEYFQISRMIQEGKLPKENTYIFELVSPEQQIVIRYPETKLYHIGTRNNLTGQECNMDIGVEKPEEYPLKSLDDCLKTAINLNLGQDGELHSVKKEGFVVVDQNWHRVKVKSPDYLLFHRMAGNGGFSKERILSLLKNYQTDVPGLCESFPSFAHYIKYYDFKVTELEYQAKVFCDLTDALYEELGCDRKAVANVIKGHRLAAIAFRHLDSGKSAKEILQNMNPSQYNKMIPDYVPEKLSKVFWKGQ